MKTAAVPEKAFDLEALKTAADQAALDYLPNLLGELRKIEAMALARLCAASVQALPTSHGEQLLDVSEAARRLCTSEDYLYRNWHTLPFAAKYSFGLRFRESGLNAFIRTGGV